MEEDKPFACTVPECGMRFINEDHLVVHKKKHELSLSLTPTSAFKNTFVDQTPTPTRFLNAIESELFQDLNNDNPFDASFRRLNSLGGSSTPIIHEASSLISGLPDTEPLSTPSIMLTNEPDSILTSHHETNVISLKNPPPLRIQKKKASLDDSPETLPFSPTTPIFSSSKESDKTEDSSNIQSKRTVSSVEDVSRIKEQVLPNELSAAHSTVVQTPVITSIGSCTKASATCVPTAVVVTRPVTNNVPTVSSSVNHMSVITKPVNESGGEISQQLVQSVTVAPLVQLIIRLPDGQAMPVQLPMVTIAATAPTSNTHPVKSIASNSSKTTSSSLSSLAKLRLKQVLTSSQKTVQKNNHVSFSEQSVGVGSDHISSLSSSSSSQNAMDGAMSETPPSSPHNVHRPASSGRRRRAIEDDPEEKRRKSLERNRAAATRCRQKRKQWIQTLGKKADELAATNVHLQNEVNMLRNEVAHLKTMLLAHKDCPVTQQQKATGCTEVIIPAAMPLNMSIQQTANEFQEKSHDIPCIPIMELADAETSSSQNGNISDTSEMSTKDR